MPSTYIHPQRDTDCGAVEDAGAAHAAAVRRLNHGTWGTPIPAPVVYELVGDLERTGHGLSQALEQLADGLYASLDAYDVYEDDGTDPAESVRRAHAYLVDAAGHAALMGDLLEIAQNTIVTKVTARKGICHDRPQLCD